MTSPTRTFRRLVVTGALALGLAGIGAPAAFALDARIVKDYGYVSFEDYGETLKAVDSFGDGRGVRAYLNWSGGNSASVTDNGFDPNPASRNLSIPEGTKVTLTMCCTKDNVDVSCSDFVTGEA